MACGIRPARTVPRGGGVTVTSTPFTPGSLVRARRREWVVLPGSTGELLRLRPLTGSEEDITLLHIGIEPDLTSAVFPWPEPIRESSQADALLLHDALRLTLRRGAGPFRSFGQVDVTPRPYQLVPLMMALSLPTVRLLIADDVGLGKTIEALLIARELIDRGEVRRLAVLCPPHLVDQWVKEIRTRFHLPAEAVTSGSVARLERGLPQGASLFEAYPYTVVSLDYIKSDRRRDEFARACPELIVVDEAHTCTTGAGQRHQRYQLLRQLMADPLRHAVLCTATPHSGDEHAFARLLALIDPAFEAVAASSDQAMPADLRDRLSRHLVQRRRADIREWNDQTLFPSRQVKDVEYRLTGIWEAFLEAVLAYCEGLTTEAGSDETRRRLAFWGTLALLRCVTSSPAAAASALSTRLHTGAANEVIEEFREQLLEIDPDAREVPDDLELPADDGSQEVAALLQTAVRLKQEGNDPKLTALVDALEELLEAGHSPIVFCHYIATAEYVAEKVKAKFRDVQVACVTGRLPAEAREEAIAAIDLESKRILVATDCLSEGVNLQDAFDAVVHYDLSWNPTRHEQREGRVDRFGQRSLVVRAVHMFGANNPIDGAVLQVILRKARAIAERLGVPVPLPDQDQRITEALLKAVMFRNRGRADTGQMAFDLEGIEEAQEFDAAWRDAEERTRKVRTKFAQGRLKPEQVIPEFERAQRALGDTAELERFVMRAMSRIGAEPERSPQGVLTLNVASLPTQVRERLEAAGIEKARIRVVMGEKGVGSAAPMRRSHPVPTVLSETLVERTLEAGEGAAGSEVLGRIGVWPTRAVSTRTVLLLARLRHELTLTRRGADPITSVVEEAVPIAVVAGEERPLTDDEASRLLLAAAEGTLPDPVRTAQYEWLAGEQGRLQRILDLTASTRAEMLVEDHRRVRDAADARGSYGIRAITPVDVIGAWILLPVPA